MRLFSDLKLVNALTESAILFVTQDLEALEISIESILNSPTVQDALISSVKFKLLDHTTVSMSQNKIDWKLSESRKAKIGLWRIILIMWVTHCLFNYRRTKQAEWKFRLRPF